MWQAASAVYLMQQACGLDKLLVPGVGVGVVHHKGFGVDCKAEAHADHGLDVHYFVLQIPCEALIIPWHQVL